VNKNPLQIGQVPFSDGVGFFSLLPVLLRSFGFHFVSEFFGSLSLLKSALELDVAKTFISTCCFTICVFAALW
jgi:hypothetical protein